MYGRLSWYKQSFVGAIGIGTASDAFAAGADDLVIRTTGKIVHTGQDHLTLQLDYLPVQIHLRVMMESFLISTILRDFV